MVVSAQNNSYVYCYMPTSLSTDIERKESAENNICSKWRGEQEYG